MHGDFEILGWKHLAGSPAGAELDLELRERLRLVVLGLIGLYQCPKILEKSWNHQLNLWYVGRGLKVRFPHSKNGKIWDFLKLGQRPLEGSQMVLVEGRVVWNGQFWCFEGSWVHFGSFADTFFWPFSFPRRMHGDFEILGWKHLGGS